MNTVIIIYNDQGLPVARHRYCGPGDPPHGHATPIDAEKAKASSGSGKRVRSHKKAEGL